MTIAQFVQDITADGGTGMVTVDYGSGSPQEAAAELAYLDGSPTRYHVARQRNRVERQQRAGGRPSNWGTVGYWAGLRGASPLATDDGLNFLRIGHSAPFTDIKYWEIGNEEYGSWEIDHHGTATPGGASTGPARPGHLRGLRRAIRRAGRHDPEQRRSAAAISIGIDSGDPTGASDGDWTKNVLTDGLADGFVPGFISDHSYMQAPGTKAIPSSWTTPFPTAAACWIGPRGMPTTRPCSSKRWGARPRACRSWRPNTTRSTTNPGKQIDEPGERPVHRRLAGQPPGERLQRRFRLGPAQRLSTPARTTATCSMAGAKGAITGNWVTRTTTAPPTTGPYVAYPGYYALQLASKIIQSGGEVVSATSNYGDLDVYAVKEPSGDLDLLGDQRQSGRRPDRRNSS